MHLSTRVERAIRLPSPCPLSLRSHGVETRLVLKNESGRTRSTDDALIDFVARAHGYLDDLTSGRCAKLTEVAASNHAPPSEVSRTRPNRWGKQSAGRGNVETILRYQKIAGNRQQTEWWWGQSDTNASPLCLTGKLHGILQIFRHSDEQSASKRSKFHLVSSKFPVPEKQGI